MSNTLAQNPSAVSYSGATSVSATFASAMTNPSLVIVSLTMETPTATATISDNKNAGNYTQDVTATQNAGGGGDGKAIIASKQNTQTAAATVTATLSTSTFGMLKIQEYTGAATSAALDTTNGGANGTNTQPTGSLTTGTANCTVIAASTHYGNGATTDTGYTAAYAETGLSNAYHYGEYRVDAGAAGAITLHMGFVGNESGWNMAVAAYKTSGGAGSVPDEDAEWIQFVQQAA